MTENRWWIPGDKQPGDHTSHLPRKVWRIRILHFPGEIFPSKSRFLHLIIFPYLALMAILFVVLILEVAL